MAGITHIEIRETTAELEGLIQQQSNPNLKERLQVLYPLQLPNAMSVSAVAKVIGRHRRTVQRWLSQDRDTGLVGLLETRALPRTTAGDSRVGSDEPETAFG